MNASLATFVKELKKKVLCEDEEETERREEAISFPLHIGSAQQYMYINRTA